MSDRKCKIAECDRPHYGKGLCRLHYDRSRKRPPRNRPKCSVDWCVNPRNGKTYCKAHEDHIKAGRDPGPLQRRGRVVDGKKVCIDCERLLPVEMFYPNQKSVSPRCKACQSIKARRVRYGITHDEASLLSSVTECNACGNPLDMNHRNDHCIDHDHATGAVRGVLCLRCNMALGYAQDSPEVLRALADYVERAAN
jgi:hypothetical protein